MDRELFNKAQNIDARLRNLGSLFGSINPKLSRPITISLDFEDLRQWLKEVVGDKIKELQQEFEKL